MEFAILVTTYPDDNMTELCVIGPFPTDQEARDYLQRHDLEGDVISAYSPNEAVNAAM